MAKRKSRSRSRLLGRDPTGHKNGAHREEDNTRDENEHMDKTRRIKMRDRSVTSCKDHISQPVQRLGPIWPKSGESFQKCKKTRASEVSRRPKMQVLDTTLFTNGMDAPDLATVKDFLRFHIPTRHGEIIEKPTADLVNIFANGFSPASPVSRAH
jgi:hypothetical protein